MGPEANDAGVLLQVTRMTSKGRLRYVRYFVCLVQ
jgi:hypothetical protein